MIPILYEGTETEFTDIGLGELYDATECIVTEERNGKYELEMTYPTDGFLFPELKLGRLIYAKPSDKDDGQPFQIYSIEKELGGDVKINAEHISYRLSGIPVAPFTATSLSEAIGKLLANALIDNDFNFASTAERSGTFTFEKPKSMRSLLNGSNDSLVKTFADPDEVELYFDKFNIYIYENRGSNAEFSIEYGKNLIDLKQEESIEDTYTGCIAYWKKDDQLIKSEVKYASNHLHFPFENIEPLDVTSDYSDAPSVSELNTQAQTHANALGKPTVNLDIDFVDIYKYIGGQVLETINLCDTVTIKFSKLDIDTTAKVVETKYDTLLEKYKKLSIGNTKFTFNDAILETVRGD